MLNRLNTIKKNTIQHVKPFCTVVLYINNFCRFVYTSNLLFTNNITRDCLAALYRVVNLLLLAFVWVCPYAYSLYPHLRNPSAELFLAPFTLGLPLPFLAAFGFIMKDLTRNVSFLNSLEYYTISL